jgi:hypothetical protein
MDKNIHKKTIDFFYSNYRERINKKIDHDSYQFKGFEKQSQPAFYLIVKNVTQIFIFYHLNFIIE